MDASQYVILGMITTPLLILARDAYRRRQQGKSLVLALAVLAAIAVNVAVTLATRR